MAATSFEAASRQQLIHHVLVTFLSSETFLQNSEKNTNSVNQKCTIFGFNVSALARQNWLLQDFLFYTKSATLRSRHQINSVLREFKLFITQHRNCTKTSHRHCHEFNVQAILSQNHKCTYFPLTKHYVQKIHKRKQYNRTSDLF